MFHGDTSPRWGGHPPRFSHFVRRGPWGNVSLCPPFGEMQGDAGGCISPVWGACFPKRGAFRHPPSKRGASGRTIFYYIYFIYDL